MKIRSLNISKKLKSHYGLVYKARAGFRTSLTDPPTNVLNIPSYADKTKLKQKLVLPAYGKILRLALSIL
jgi:hypothetical protein